MGLLLQTIHGILEVTQPHDEVVLHAQRTSSERASCTPGAGAAPTFSLEGDDTVRLSVPASILAIHILKHEGSIVVEDEA